MLELSKENENKLCLKPRLAPMREDLVSPFMGRMVDRYNDAVHRRLFDLEQAIRGKEFVAAVNEALNRMDPIRLYERILPANFFSKYNGSLKVTEFEGGHQIRGNLVDSIYLSEYREIEPTGISRVLKRRPEVSSYGFKLFDSGYLLKTSLQRQIWEDMRKAFRLKTNAETSHIELRGHPTAIVTSTSGTCFFHCTLSPEQKLKSFAVKTWHPAFEGFIAAVYDANSPDIIRYLHWTEIELKRPDKRLRPAIETTPSKEDLELVTDLIDRASGLAGASL